ncbi:hypothetical protein Tco_0194672 [Tanacetum coccineum]
MAQHMIPAAQLVPQYKPIGRCNNYAVLQSIPCSPECKIVGLILLDHCLSYALTATADVPDVYLQQFWRTVSKLIVADLIKKFLDIPKRLQEDYHSIKDDVLLVSVYTMGNVSVRGMLILDAFLTAKIRETNDFKEYETVFMKVDVLMNQPQLVVSTQGTHRITPSAQRTPTVSASPSKSKKMKQIVGESSSPRKSLKVTIKQKQLVEKDDDDSENRIEPVSHKDNPEVVDDDDDNKREKKDDEMGSLEIRNEEMQTTIPTPLSSPMKILSSDKKTFQELTDIVSNPSISTSKHSQVKKRISSKYSHLPGALRRMYRRQDRADDIALWEALRRKFEKSSTSNTSCREDDFHSHHDEHQDDNASPEGEKRVKRSKKIKSLKSAREENDIDEDEATPEDVTPELIAESHNVDKRVLTIFDHARMEATLRDSLSNLSINAEKYAYHLEQSTSFMENRIVWESRQQDILRTIPKTLVFYGPQRNPNEPLRPLYNKDLFFLKYGNTEEKNYIFSLHKIHAEEFPEPELEEKVYKQNQKKVKKNPEDYYSNHRIIEVVRIVTDQPHGLDFMEQILVMRANDKPDSFSEADFKYLNKNDIEDLYYLYRSKEIDNHKVKLMNSLIMFIRKHAPYTIVDEIQMGLIYLNSKDEKRVMYLEEIIKFCDATLEKVLNEVKLRMFESKFLKKPPLLGELDQDIMKAYEREISKRLNHRQQMRRWESFMNGRPIIPMMKRL